MTVDLKQLADQIPGGVEWTGNGEGKIHCPYPNHEDKNPSCSINVEKNTFLCHACREKGTLTKLLKHCGIDVPKQSHFDANYDYTDGKGNPLYRVVRTIKDGKKDFFCQRSNGAGGWTGGRGCMNGVEPVPYHLPDILQAIITKQPVFVVEGEKDANRLKREGLNATTNHGGAKKWRDCHSKYFTGASVILVADCDEPGKVHMEKVAASLSGIADRIRMLDLGYEIKKEHGKDISDWLTEHSRHELTQIANAAKEWQAPKQEKIKIISLESERTADIPARTWFVNGFLTTGSNLIVGKKGVGKSFFAIDMAIAIAGGDYFLGRETTQSRVLYVPTELDRIGVHERIQDFPPIPADLFVHYFWSAGVQALQDAERMIVEENIRVLIFDMFLPIVPEVETNAYESSGKFLKWRQLGQKHQVAIVELWHTGKAPRKDFMDSVIGTTGLVGQCDSIISLERPRAQSLGKIFVGGNHGEELALGAIFENCHWHLTTGDEDFLSIGDSELIKLVESRDRTTPTDAVAATTGRTYNATRMALARLYERGLIRKTGRGVYGPNNDNQSEQERTYT